MIPYYLSDTYHYIRDGPNARGGKTMYLSAIKLYETVNLLEVEQGKITITPETTPNMSTFEPINLLQNLQNRSCGGTEQSGMLSAKNPLTFLDQKTCFRSSMQ